MDVALLITKDSEFLSKILEDYGEDATIQSILIEMGINYTTIEKIYSGNYDLTKDEIMQSILDLHKLGCNAELNSLLILARHHGYTHDKLNWGIIECDAEIEYNKSTFQLAIKYECNRLLEYFIKIGEYSIEFDESETNFINCQDFLTAAYAGNLLAVKIFVIRMKELYLEKRAELSKSNNKFKNLFTNYYVLIQDAFMAAGQDAHFETMKYLYSADDRIDEEYEYSRETEYYSLGEQLDRINGKNLQNCAFFKRHTKTFIWLCENNIDARECRQDQDINFDDVIEEKCFEFYDAATKYYIMSEIDAYYCAINLIDINDLSRYDDLIISKHFERVNSKTGTSCEQRLFTNLLEHTHYSRAMDHYNKYEPNLDYVDFDSGFVEAINNGKLDVLKTLFPHIEIICFDMSCIKFADHVSNEVKHSILNWMIEVGACIMDDDKYTHELQDEYIQNFMTELGMPWVVHVPIDDHYVPTVAPPKTESQLLIDFIYSCSHGHYNGAEWIMKQINISDDDKITGLFYACQIGDIKIVLLLFQDLEHILSPNDVFRWSLKIKVNRVSQWLLHKFSISRHTFDELLNGINYKRPNEATRDKYAFIKPHVSEFALLNFNTYGNR